MQREHAQRQGQARAEQSRAHGEGGAYRCEEIDDDFASIQIFVEIGVVEIDHVSVPFVEIGATRACCECGRVRREHQQQQKQQGT